MSAAVPISSSLSALPVSAATVRWLEVVSHLDPKYGGLSAAVPALARKLAEDPALDVSIAAFCAEQERCGSEGFAPDQVTNWPVSRKPWIRNPTLRDAFAEQLRQVDGLHIHGLWEQSTAVAAQTARKLRIPYVLSAHGMLEPWALANKRLKKLVYSRFVERTNVARAACLHALTQAEAEQYIRFGARCPIAVIPNAVQIPEIRDASLFRQRFPELEGKRLVLFLGRLHPKKGLDLLVSAWSELARTWPDARLVLAGPDCEGTQAQLEKVIKRHTLTSSLVFTGMLSAEMKWAALAAAECFVLPSYSEGLSVSILEAMGAGLPVIVTRQCNMPEVDELQTGWQIEPDVKQLTTALNHCLSNSPEANRHIGARGAELIQDSYSWATVTKKMSDLYQWVLGGPLPTSFNLIFARKLREKAVRNHA